MAIMTVETVSCVNAFVDFKLNYRDVNDYDVESLIPVMLERGGLFDRLTAERMPDGRLRMLRGNRRLLTAQRLYNDPSTPESVRKQLEGIQMEVWTGLSDSERHLLMQDQGSQKAYSRAEIAKAIWAMRSSGMTPGSIAVNCVNLLARFTGNEKKLATLSKNPKERETEIKKWFHGSLDNLLLQVWGFPDFAKESYLQTLRLSDKGKLPEGEEVSVNMKADRIRDLAKAKAEDLANGTWDVTTGGVSFKKLWDLYYGEDHSGVIAPKTVRPKKKDLLDQSGVMLSELGKAAFRLAADGEPNADLIRLDKDAYLGTKLVQSLSALAGGDEVKTAELVKVVQEGKFVSLSAENVEALTIASEVKATGKTVQELLNPPSPIVDAFAKECTPEELPALLMALTDHVGDVIKLLRRKVK